MNDDIQNSLNELRKSYNKNLPSKIEVIDVAWNKIKKSYSDSAAYELYIHLHNLKGSAAAYGQVLVSEIVSNLETIVDGILRNKKLANDSVIEFESKLQELKSTPLAEADASVTKSSMNESCFIPDRKEIIYLIDTDTDWANKFCEKVKSFDYHIESYNDINAVLSKKNSENRILMIDVDVLKGLSPAAVSQLYDYGNNHPIIFTANNSDIESRISAIRAGGIIYLVKPFLMEEFIIEIEKIKNLYDNQYRVLIIDDDREVGTLYTKLLELNGIRTLYIDHVDALDEALHVFKPSIILLDCYMPNVNGAEVSSVIRQQKCFENIPILFLSAESSESKQMDAMLYGVEGFLTKRMMPDNIVKNIKKNVRRYKSLVAQEIKDSLTNVFNRAFILQQLFIELATVKNINIPLSIAIVNISGMTEINKRYGYCVGDQVIRRLSMLLSDKIISANIIGRYTQDEFLVILPDISISRTESLLNFLRTEFHKIKFTSKDETFTASFNFGIANYPTFSTHTMLINGAYTSLQTNKKANLVEA